MQIDGLREAIAKNPFEPFAIQLADGRSILVKHPEFVAVGKRRAVVIQDDDSCLWLEPLLIVSLDWPAKKESGRNGSHGKKRKS
jgi:hypothetical protein